MHPKAVSLKLKIIVNLGRKVSPFSSPPLDSLFVSLSGVVPKKEPSKCYLIYHLSHPKDSSVNFVLDPELCIVSYLSFDEAVA